MEHTEVHNVNEAVGLLLAEVPELQPAWDRRCSMFDTTDAEHIGIYVIFGELVLPLLATLLAGPDEGRFDRQYPGVLPASKSRRDAIVVNIYDVLESWATSDNDSIRHATALEMIGEGGYGSLSGDELLLHAGPRLLALKNR